MSRWRSVIGRLAGRSRGEPSAAKPSSTCTLPSSGSTVAIGPSSDSLPCSTSCMAQAPVMALVIEAIQTTVSAVIGAPEVVSRTPEPPAKIGPSAVAAATTTPGTSPASVARFSRSVIACVFAMARSSRQRRLRRSLCRSNRGS